MEKQAPDGQAPSDQAASLDLLAILNRRKAWLVFVLLCWLGLWVGLLFLVARRYESRAELLLMQNDNEPMSASNGAERDVSEELLSTHMKLVQSSRIVTKALNVDVAQAANMAKIDDNDFDERRPTASRMRCLSLLQRQRAIQRLLQKRTQASR